AAVADRVDRLLAPLQQPLGLGEGAFLLHMRGRRHEEDLRAALLRDDLAGRDLGCVLPERRGLDLDQVADHQPVGVGHSEPLCTSSGALFTSVADSISTRSRTTSQSSLAIPSRWARACDEPTAVFWPSRKYPLTLPSLMSSTLRYVPWSPVSRGR